MQNAVNGQDAIMVVEEALKLNKVFDFMILDLHMPICDGFRAAGIIRNIISDTQMAHCKLIGLSAITQN